MKPSTSEFHDIRGLRYHLRCWGPPTAPKLFLLHGWMDVSASFQFMVDALQQEWRVIAPDWRGFGLTAWAPGGYWFPDYYGDLDAILDLCAPDAPVNLVGHSMGGNIACTYAGIRPRRVAKLVSLEGFGAARTTPGEAPARYARWLDQLRQAPAFRPYPSFDAVATRLRKSNPRLGAEQAEFLARHWAEEDPAGSVRLRADPRHKRTNPVLSRIDEHLACWRNVTAPVLWIDGADSVPPGLRADAPAQRAERRAAFADFRALTLPAAGHMLHHDQPRLLAQAVEFFCVNSKSGADGGC